MTAPPHDFVRQGVYGNSYCEVFKVFGDLTFLEAKYIPNQCNCVSQNASPGREELDTNRAER